MSQIIPHSIIAKKEGGVNWFLPVAPQRRQ